MSYDVAHRTVRRQNTFGWFSRWPWNTLRNYMCGVACCRKERGKRYTMRRMERGFWGGGVGKEWTEKENFQQYFYNRYKILHICHTYCCYAYHFYAYWLYFIYVWHVYVSPKTYKCVGTFIIKDGRYTFTFFRWKIFCSKRYDRSIPSTNRFFRNNIRISRSQNVIWLSHNSDVEDQILPGVRSCRPINLPKTGVAV
jgi:hypothetical protein